MPPRRPARSSPPPPGLPTESNPDRPSDYFPVRITGPVTGPPAGYSFVEVWEDGDGVTVEKVGGRVAGEANPAIPLDGTVYAADDYALARSAPGAGGLLWELVAASQATNLKVAEFGAAGLSSNAWTRKTLDGTGAWVDGTETGTTGDARAVRVDGGTFTRKPVGYNSVLMWREPHGGDYNAYLPLQYADKVGSTYYAGFMGTGVQAFSGEKRFDGGITTFGLLDTNGMISSRAASTGVVAGTTIDNFTGTLNGANPANIGWVDIYRADATNGGAGLRFPVADEVTPADPPYHWFEFDARDGSTRRTQGYFKLRAAYSDGLAGESFQGTMRVYQHLSVDTHVYAGGQVRCVGDIASTTGGLGLHFTPTPIGFEVNNLQHALNHSVGWAVTDGGYGSYILDTGNTSARIGVTAYHSQSPLDGTPVFTYPAIRLTEGSGGGTAQIGLTADKWVRLTRTGSERGRFATRNFGICYDSGTGLPGATDVIWGYGDGSGSVGPGFVVNGGIITDPGAGTFIGTATANTFTASQTFDSTGPTAVPVTVNGAGTGPTTQTANLLELREYVGGPLLFGVGIGSCLFSTDSGLFEFDGDVHVVGDLGVDGTVTAAFLAGDGSAVTALDAAALAAGTVPTARLGSGVASGSTVLYGDSTWGTVPAGYTDEQAQDAVGAMAANSARVTLTYADGTPSLTADLVANSVTAGYLHATATDVLFGRSTAGAGAGEEIACTAAARTVLDDTTVGAMLTTLGGQPLDATLTAFAALTIAANSLTVGTGADAFSQVTFAANTFPARMSTGNLAAYTVSDFGISLLGGASATADRGLLGLVIGTNVQAWSANLDAIAGAGSGADKLIYYTGVSTAAATVFTAFARTLLDDTTAAAARTTLGLVIGTDVQAQDAELSAIAGLTSAADKVPYFTGSGTAALATVTAAARTVLDDATVGDMLTTLGAGWTSVSVNLSTNQTGLTQNAWNLVAFDTEVTDSQGEYDISTQVFTPAASGLYLVTFTAVIGGVTNRVIGALLTAGGGTEVKRFGDGIVYQCGGSALVDLTAATGYAFYVFPTDAGGFAAGSAQTALRIRRIY